jgi:tape measure domain-containing protein
MADFTTSDTYNNLLKAANAAFSKIGVWNSSTTEGNKKMTSSLAEIQAAMARIDKLKMNTTSLDSVAKLDNIKARYQQRINDIQAYSDKANKIKPPVEDNFPVGELLSGAASLVKIGVAAQQTNQSFEQFTGGSASMAKSIVSNLREMAATSPYNSAELMKGAQSLLASGTAVESVLPTLNALGEVSGGDNDKLGALSTAFSKLQQDGHLTGETMKAMLAAGFDPLKSIPGAAGISMDQLTQSLKDGCFSADEVTKSLMDAARAGQIMGGDSGSAADAFHRLNERFDAATATVGASLMPIVTGFVDGALIPMAAALQQVATFISENIDWIGGFVTVIGTGLVVYQLWAAAQGLVNALMSANPVGLVIAGVVGLIAGVVYLWNTFSGFRGTVMGVWEVLKGLGKIILDIAIGPIKNMLSGISGLMDALGYLINGDFDKAGEAGFQALKDLTNFSTLEAVAGDVMEMGKNTAAAYQDGLNAAPITLDGLMGGAPDIPHTDELMSGGVVKTGPNWKAKDPRLGAAAKAQAEGITSGGARNVTLNLQKLFDNINITTNTIAEGISDMEQQVTDALLRILNNANATT